MSAEKGTSSNLAGLELVESKGLGITLCQVGNINSFCPLCKILLVIVRQQQWTRISQSFSPRFTGQQKLLVAP